MLSGSLVDVGYAQAMTAFLRRQGVRVFDYPEWASQFREAIRAHAQSVASEHGVEIEFVRPKDLRKQQRIQEILAVRGEQHPGLVHIFGSSEIRIRLT